MSRPAAAVPDGPNGRRACVRAGLLFGALGLVIAGVAVAVASPGRSRPVALVAAFLLLVLGGLLLVARPSGLRDGRHAAPRDGWRAVAAARQPVLLVNPHAGGGTTAGAVESAARRAGIEVRRAGEPGTLAELAEAAVRDGADCVGVAGGDGSLAEVAAVAAAAGVPFVCVPAGTYNHFAQDLGLDRSDPVAALGAFGPARQRRVDLGEVSGRPFLNNVSMGAYGEVVADERYRDHKVSVALARVPDFLGRHGDPPQLDVVDDRGNRVDGAVVVHVSNNPYDLAPRPGFGTRPSLSDGRLGVVVVGRPAIGAALRPALWTAPTVTVSSAGPLKVGIDGEAVELPSPVQCSVRPGVLEVRIPPDAVGRSPSARGGAVGRLLRRAASALAAGFTSVP